MTVQKITDKEWELIQTIRNYRRAYPNGSRMLEKEINDLLDELMDTTYQQEEEEPQKTEKQ